MTWETAIVAAVMAVLVAGVSTRLTRVLVADRVPFGRPRLWAQWKLEYRWARRNGVTVDAVTDAETWLSPGAYLLGCSWCTGVYVAGAATLVTDVTVGVPVPLLVWGTAAYAAGRYGGE